MGEEICVLDYSAPEILACLLRSPEIQHLELNLPLEVGFQQRDDGSLIACFGDAFKHLDPNAKNTVRFPELEIYMKELADEVTLEAIFKAFASEIFERRLPDMGYFQDAQATELYVIMPHQWQVVHREQLRQALKQYRPKLTLKGCVSEVFCAIAYYLFRDDKHAELTNALTDTGELDLFIFDFRIHELKIWHVSCCQTESEHIFDIQDVRLYPNYLFEEKKKFVSSINAFIRTAPKSKEHVALRGFGVIEPQREEFVKSLLAQYHGFAEEDNIESKIDLSPFKPHYNVCLEGLATLIDFLKNEERLKKNLCFKYQFCFGIRLPVAKFGTSALSSANSDEAVYPDQKFVEILPKNSTPPCESKRAFRLTGRTETFYLDLLCGLTLAENSCVIHLASHDVSFDDYRGETMCSPSNGSLEFIVSVELEDYTKGKFSVILPQGKTQMTEFTVPTLMG